ncbi:MAG: hypothetical protein KDC98_05305 [Planctomycetes bacterium]|nr:hypothetical protein [Planctomycetota bacterium]
MFCLLALAVTIVVIEAAAAIAWWAATGEMFTWGSAAAARARARAGDATATAAHTADDFAARWVAAHGVMVHPYLGFVNDAAAAVNAPHPCTPFGFFGTSSPVRQRSEDRYIIGVVGGSVAMHFGLFAPTPLAEALRRSPALASREIEVVDLALGGYKQPQQLLAVQLMLVLGGQFDCIVNLDGFNEIALVQENVPLGVPAWYPRSWARLLDAVPTADQQRRLGHIAVLSELREQRIATADTLWWSPLAQFFWQWRDRSLVVQIAQLLAAVDRAAAAPSPALIGRGTDGATVAESRRQMVAVWQRASLQLRSLCEANGIRYFHFLQPNQYVPGSKPIGPEEAAVAIDVEHPWRKAVLEAFPLLQRAGAELVREGVAFTDLTGVFADHEEPLYTDSCCHFGQKGHAILAAHIAAAIRRKLDLEGVELVRLQVSPERIELSSPLLGKRLEVTGIDAGGVLHDISGAGFGTRISAQPADHVQIAADGTVRARRRGKSMLRVEQGAEVTEVEVVADWADVFEGDDGLAPPGGEVPRLLLDPDELAAGAKTLTVACRDLPAARFRVVAVAPEPLPDTVLGAERFGLLLVPITADGDHATVQVPVAAPAGQPMFVRFYAVAENMAAVIAKSNTIVITRG